MRFVAVASGVQGCWAFLHLVRFAKRHLSLLADAGYLSKGVEVLGTGRGRLFVAERVIQRSQSGNDSGLRTKDQSAESSFQKATAMSRREFRICPATLRADRDGYLCSLLTLQDHSQRRSGCSLRKHHAQTIFAGSQHVFWFYHFAQHGHANVP